MAPLALLAVLVQMALVELLVRPAQLVQWGQQVYKAPTALPALQGRAVLRVQLELPDPAALAALLALQVQLAQVVLQAPPVLKALQGRAVFRAISAQQVSAAQAVQRGLPALRALSAQQAFAGQAVRRGQLALWARRA